jgi:glycosyltransferase involved in cell wall biosynthesis
MRVLVLTNMYPSEHNPSSGIFVKEQVADLRALGLDVRVLAFDGTQHRLNYVRAGTRLRSILKHERFDLVHAHYGLTGAVALSQRSVPVVTTFHGSDYNGNVPWQVHVSRFVARHTAPIIVSQEARLRLGVPDAPIIPAGVDTDLFVPRDRSGARKELGWDVEARYALFAGRRTVKEKNYGLFDAAVRLAQRSTPELRGIALDGFSRQAVAHVMNAVDVTLITSDAEGSPVAVKESLACGTPVVAVPVGDLPALLAGLPGCAVAARDPHRLADALTSALAASRDEALRHRILPFARPRIAERVRAVYEEAARKEGGEWRAATSPRGRLSRQIPPRGRRRALSRRRSSF